MRLHRSILACFSLSIVPPAAIVEAIDKASPWAELPKTQDDLAAIRDNLLAVHLQSAIRIIRVS